MTMDFSGTHLHVPSYAWLFPALVPGILALVHTTCGHPGVARITELIQRKYHWTSLKATSETTCFLAGAEGSNDPPPSVSPCYQLALSSPGKSLKRTSTTVEARSEAGNKYRLVVERASKFLFSYPLPTKPRKMCPSSFSKCC